MQKKKRFAYKPVRKAPVRKQLDWSPYQKDIFSNVAEGDDNLMIEAVAGSSKTTSIIESMYHLPERYRYDNKTLFTSFGAAAAKHLADQIPDGVVAKTHHQLGFHTVLKHWGATYSLRGYGSVDPHEYGALELAKKQVGNHEDFWRLHLNLVYAMNMAKTVLADSQERVEDILYEYPVDIGGLEPDQFAEYVWNMMEETRNSPMIHNGKSMISFVDMIWLPHVHGWVPEQYERVYIDEVQDTNPARFELLLNSLAYGGRMFAVGDPSQAIFSWAGVEENVINKLTNQLTAKCLPLSVSYRCPKSAVALAKMVNSKIEPAPNAIDGCVERFSADTLLDRLQAGVVVLSRTNWPLIKLCFKLLAKGRHANMVGNEMADRFLWRIRCWNPDSVAALRVSINDWKEKTCERLLLKHNKKAAESVIDEALSIEQFCDYADSIDEVKKYINMFFNNKESKITLSSTHRAKGLEWDNVIMLDKTFKPEQGGEEARIWYVAVTRTKNYLGIAEGKLL